MSEQLETRGKSLVVRAATANDMSAIAEIYGYEVLHGIATFEEEVPTQFELDERRRAISSLDLPYLVAEIDGVVAGYSYASTYRPRPAYRYTVENTVYVARDARGNGVAEALLNALVEHCTQKGLRQMIAVIAVVDDKVSNASTSLHSKLDFRLIGNVEGAGFKHGQWVDTVLMQRKLGPGISTNPGCIN